jgi:uncharacterized damage-inducible protein DinB
MQDDERRALVERYKAGAKAVASAVSDLDDAALDRRPSSDAWTVREIVHHLADMEMTAGIRLRRLLTEDNPAILNVDEEQYARVLHYDRPIQASLDAIDAIRRTSAELLDRMTEADWMRSGTHSEMGAYAVTDWLRIYTDHPYAHVAQIRESAVVA